MEKSKSLAEEKQEIIKELKRQLSQRGEGWLRLKSAKQEKGGTPPYQKKQVPDLDEYFTSSDYTRYNVMEPPYLFSNLYTMYEESDVLQECIDTYILNIDGFGYDLKFLGEDQTQKDTAQAKNEYLRAESFFDHSNENESFKTIRKKMRKDYEILGNGGFEVIRDLSKKIALMYYIPFSTLRMSRLGTEPVVVKVKIMREGKPIEIKVRKYFRRFVQCRATGENVRWFKSFGDPRVLNMNTGEFITDGEGKVLPGKSMIPLEIQATEIMHFKQDLGSQAYGVPAWMSISPDIRGRRFAQYVNYDLFDNQGIPPIIITVSGGSLSDESYDELATLIQGMRGVENWNKITVLESNLESVGLEEKGTAKIEIKNMADFRREDLMFGSYLKDTEKTIRHRYRLPPLYVGAAESFTHSTSKNARLVAEEQVFIPAREDFDEIIQNEIVFRELGITLWKYTSMGPKIVGSEELSKGVETFSKAGAFTINHAIQRANEAFGLSMSQFKEDWANYPIPIVLKLVELGKLKGLDSIENAEGMNILPTRTTSGEAQVARQNLSKAEKIEDKILNSDMFNPEEKDLYRKLMTIHHAVAKSEDKNE